MKTITYTAPAPLKKTWEFTSSKQVRRAIKDLKRSIAQGKLKGSRVQATFQAVLDLNNQVLVDMYDLEEGC